MSNIFAKGIEMLDGLRRRIFGVPDDYQTAANPQPSDYRPESLLRAEITAGSEDIDAWQPWRVDADGEQWYVRAGAVDPEVHGVATDLDDDDFEDDEMVDLDDDFEEGEDDEC